MKCVGLIPLNRIHEPRNSSEWFPLRHGKGTPTQPHSLCASKLTEPCACVTAEGRKQNRGSEVRAVLMSSSKLPQHLTRRPHGRLSGKGFPMEHRPGCPRGPVSTVNIQTDIPRSMLILNPPARAISKAE